MLSKVLFSISRCWWCSNDHIHAIFVGLEEAKQEFGQSMSKRGWLNGSKLNEQKVHDYWTNAETFRSDNNFTLD